MRELLTTQEKNQWSNAEKQWTEFVKNKNGREPIVRAWYRLGESMDKNDKSSQALTPYVAVMGKYASRIEFSIPAAARSATIQKSSGEKCRSLQTGSSKWFKI